MRSSARKPAKKAAPAKKAKVPEVPAKKGRPAPVNVGKRVYKLPPPSALVERKKSPQRKEATARVWQHPDDAAKPKKTIAKKKAAPAKKAKAAPKGKAPAKKNDIKAVQDAFREVVTILNQCVEMLCTADRRFQCTSPFLDRSFRSFTHGFCSLSSAHSVFSAFL